MDNLKNIKKEQLFKMIQEMKEKMQNNGIKEFKIQIPKDTLKLYRKNGWTEQKNGIEYLFNLRVEGI